MKFRWQGNKGELSALTMFNLKGLLSYGSVKEAVDIYLKICQEVSTGDTDSESIDYFWYLSCGTELDHQERK